MGEPWETPIYSSETTPVVKMDHNGMFQMLKLVVFVTVIAVAGGMIYERFNK